METQATHARTHARRTHARTYAHAPTQRTNATRARARLSACTKYFSQNVLPCVTRTFPRTLTTCVCLVLPAFLALASVCGRMAGGGAQVGLSSRLRSPLRPSGSRLRACRQCGRLGPAALRPYTAGADGQCTKPAQKRALPTLGAVVSLTHSYTMRARVPTDRARPKPRAGAARAVGRRQPASAGELLGARRTADFGRARSTRPDGRRSQAVRLFREILFAPHGAVLLPRARSARTVGASEVAMQYRSESRFTTNSAHTRGAFRAHGTTSPRNFAGPRAPLEAQNTCRRGRPRRASPARTARPRRASQCAHP